MNEEIFKPHRFEMEIENNAKEFFEPLKMTLIDASLKNYKPYKTSWDPMD